MGLAGSFGNQGYVCKTCGLAMEAYAPHCPKCLNKTLVRTQQDKKPVFKNSDNGPAPSEQPRPGVNFGVIAAVVVAFVALYTFFGPKVPLLQQKAEEPVKEEAPKPAVVPVHHVKHVAAHPATPTVHHTVVTPVAGSSPHHAPMKLWEVSRDGESTP